MPQLNPEFFLSQIFWLVITFSFLLIFLWKISLPRISNVLIKRENKINQDILSAKKLQTEAEEIQLEIDKQLSSSHDQALKLIQESNFNLQKHALVELEKFDIEISKKIDESSNLIQKNKDNALQDINKQINEITKLTLMKLSKIKITDQELSEAIIKTQSKMVN